MATLTRSSRRIDGLHPHHANANTHLLATSAARNAAQNLFPRGGSGRNKRSLDGSECDFDPLSRKRTRIAVEIASHAPNAATRPPVRSVASAPTVPLQRPQQHPQEHPQRDNVPSLQHVPPGISPKSDSTSPPTTAPIDTKTRATNAPPNQSGSSQKDANSNLTKHQSKVRSGILHELDSLQPAAADTKPQGRKLRSQESSRFKSELSAYFPEYDEVIGNEPKETCELAFESPRLHRRAALCFPNHCSSTLCLDTLNIDTPIVILDTSPNTTRKPQSDVAASSSRDSSSVHTRTGGGGATLSQASNHKPIVSPKLIFPLQHYGDALFDELYDAQRIGLDFLETRYKGKPFDDPLPDSHFEPSHKKAERLEKSIRNAEKGRAQHERDRIVRLLDGLQGHDWLRVMGVSGITETRKKSFEPARDHFIRGCEAILEKFRRWAREEKRRKQEKDRAASEQAHDKDSAPENGGSDDHASFKDSTSHDDDEDAASHRDDGSTVSEPVSDVDASIEKQLHEEVMARSRVAHDLPTVDPVPASNAPHTNKGRSKDKDNDSKRGAKPRTKPNPKATKRKEPEPDKEFTSFFAKRHERDAAVSRARRTGRKVLAWGHPIPDMPEAEYELPERAKDAEMMKALARKKRRDRRGVKS